MEIMLQDCVPLFGYWKMPLSQCSSSSALQNLRQAEDTSNLDSDEEVPRKKSRKRSYNHLLYPGEESDEDSTSLI
ncbi:unnamed protein product [Larinioides sclopetarius]|uniref:Uncharacterized protein n=1 Tax=Larinioides sclopetarius TaxID=280406 RepID=A0AAV2BZ70_9ARAC